MSKSYKDYRENRWCCLAEIPRTPWNYYEQCPGGVVYSTLEAANTIWDFPNDWPRITLIVTTVLSNLAFVPSLFRLVQRKLAYDFIIGFATFVTSVLYHLGESTGSQILGMNPGQW